MENAYKYYTDESRRRVTRVNGCNAEAYLRFSKEWVFDQEYYDALIGELWLDEITEEEAYEIIAS